MNARTLVSTAVLTPLLLSTCAAAQHTSTVPSEYKGPVLNGICIASIDGSSGMTSAVFSASGYYRFDAERAWAAYALAQNANKPLKGTRCVWSTTPIDPAKVQISSQNGGQVKQTSWKFDPQTMLPAAATAPAQAATPGVATARVRGTAVNSQSNTALASAVPAASTPLQAPDAAQNTSTGTTSGNTTAPASISQSAQQSMQDAKNTATTAVTGSINTVTTTTVQSVTGALTNSLQGFLSRKKKDPATATQAAAAGTPPQAVNAATPPGTSTLVASAGTPPSPVDTAHPSQPQAQPGGMSFVFCHLAAAGSEYISDVFPTTLPSGSTLESAFWQYVGTQYHLTNIPYRNNVACAHSATEAESVAAIQILKSTVSQRGVNASHEVDTGWTYSGAQ